MSISRARSLASLTPLTISIPISYRPASIYPPSSTVPLRLDAAAPVPLYQQVAADIRRRIVSGDMPVGVQIPPHKELATEYGVSVITINKALSGLVSEGLLYSHVGRGTYVMVRPASTSGIAAPTTIGFVLRDLSSPFFSLIAHGAQQRADALGVGILFASSSNRLDREEEQIRRLRLLGVHGFIIVSMSRTFRLNEAIQALHDSDFPYTMVSWTAGDDVPFVGLDLAEAGFRAGAASPLAGLSEVRLSHRQHRQPQRRASHEQVSRGHRGGRVRDRSGVHLRARVPRRVERLQVRLRRRRGDRRTRRRDRKPCTASTTSARSVSRTRCSTPDFAFRATSPSSGSTTSSSPRARACR